MQTISSPRKKTGRFNAKQWRIILGRFGKSDLGPTEFCRQHKLSLPVFHRWRRKQMAEDNAPGFVELQPPATPPKSELPWNLELDLPGGGRLRIQSGL